jgi:Fanconi anemia group M protein
MSQMSNMARNFENPIVMIEGDPAQMYTERNINPNAIRGAISSIAVNFGIPIIYTTGPEDTAAFIYVIAKREQEGKIKEIALRGEKRAMSLSEWQRFVVESLPNVSSVLAKRLLLHFGSVEAVLNAQEKELQEVEGVGDKKAKRIGEIIRSKYKEE